MFYKKIYYLYRERKIIRIEMFRCFSKKAKPAKHYPLGHIHDTLIKANRHECLQNAVNELIESGIILSTAEANAFLNESEDLMNTINKAIFEEDCKALQKYMDERLITYYQLQLRASDAGSTTVLDYLAKISSYRLDSANLLIACYNNNVDLLNFLHEKCNKLCPNLLHVSALLHYREPSETLSFLDAALKLGYHWHPKASCYLAHNVDALALALRKGCPWHPETTLYAFWLNNYDKVSAFATNNSLFVYKLHQTLDSLDTNTIECNYIFHRRRTNKHLEKNNDI